MVPGQPRRTTLSRDEIAEAIRGLSDVDLVRLRRVAEAYARNCPLEPEDLLQEAFVRAVAGTRRCPRRVDVVRFLAEAMRSIASDSAKGRRRQEVHLAKFPALQPWTADAVDDRFLSERAPSLDEVRASEEEVARAIAEILNLFPDDVIAQTILKGDMAEMKAEEIRALTGLDKVGFASKRRRIRRRIDRTYPKGWNR